MKLSYESFIEITFQRNRTEDSIPFWGIILTNNYAWPSKEEGGEGRLSYWCCTGVSEGA